MIEGKRCVKCGGQVDGPQIVGEERCADCGDALPPSGASVPASHEIGAQPLYPGCMGDKFVVICRADSVQVSDGESVVRVKGSYELATRRVFDDHAEAAAYAAGVCSSRDPLVVPGRWHELRFK